MSSNDSQRETAVMLGLPETASHADIEKKRSDNFRQEIAIGLGLPKTASWDDIYKERSARSHRKAA